VCKISGRIRSSLMAILVAAVFWCCAAHAQILVHFDLPAQPLARSLKAIGTATNTDVGFSASQVAGLMAPSLRADLTLDGALMRVLAGTGLRPQHLDDHTIVIAAMESSKSDSAEIKLLPLKVSASARDDERPTTPQSTTQSDSTDEPSSSSANKKELEEIVVTGTHIRGIDNNTSPVIVIDRAQIDRSGYSSTMDLFRSLPQNFSSGDASEDGMFTASSGAFRNTEYGSGVDLRGLGAPSTLVLLNGHRLAPSASGQFVDVSQIPLAAIDRVEILTDGASAIYGSDAVGGVVNIILKRDYQGADTSIRYGAATQGGRDELQVAQTLGSTWSGGNAVGTVQFQRQGALPAHDREFASALPYPNDLLPQTRSYAATFNGRQSLSDKLEFYGDAILSKRDFTGNNSDTSYGYGLVLGDIDGDTQGIDLTPGLRFRISPQWSIDLNGLYGYQKNTNHQVEGVSPSFLNVANNVRFTEKSVDLIASGRFGATPAGNIGIAIGASYRTEALNSLTVYANGPTGLTVQHRHVAAEFAELRLPLIADANRLPMAEALELSAAFRRDHYSDFGSTTNPQVGLRWAPVHDLALRATYGNSFRAPTVFETSLEAPVHQLIYNDQFVSPSGVGRVPILAENGSKSLTPERARTLNFGLEYRPSDIPGLSAALDYYDIRYQNRIITPPYDYNILTKPAVFGSLVSPVASDAAAQAIVDAAVASGARNFVDQHGVTGVRYFFDDRQQNAALVRQSGIDLTTRVVKESGTHTLTSQASVSFISHIDTYYSPTSIAYFNQVNTVGSPAKWRARVDSTWGSKGWSITGAVNAVGSYVNASALGSPPVASWTTLDLNATLNLDAYFDLNVWRGVSLSLIVLNVFDRNPPYATSAVATFPVTYDAANASPLGRFVAVTLRKKW
jgi:iron complex outermembrane receptor protein